MLFPFYWQFSEYSNCRECRSPAIKCESVKISQIIQFSRLAFDPCNKLLSILYKILNRSPSGESLDRLQNKMQNHNGFTIETKFEFWVEIN